jgi:hypothetical protein
MIGDLEGFLKGLGLAQYIQTFRDNDIDMDALLYLEEAHLKELVYRSDIASNLQTQLPLSALTASNTNGQWKHGPPKSPAQRPCAHPAPRTAASGVN